MQNEMRDRLIELIYKIHLVLLKRKVESLANHLLANGVTVQKWISVKDRLPESSCFVLTVSAQKIMSVFHYSAKNKAFNSFDEFDDHDFEVFPTHWMPLPQPPNE